MDTVGAYLPGVFEEASTCIPVVGYCVSCVLFGNVF